MLKRPTTALAAALVAAFTAVPAAAGHTSASCGFDALRDDYHDGRIGLLSGVGDPEAFACALYLNGSLIARAPSRPVTGTVAEVVTFRASAGDVVTVCAEGTRTGHAFRNCADTVETGLPPDDVAVR